MFYSIKSALSKEICFGKGLTLAEMEVIVSTYRSTPQMNFDTVYSPRTEKETARIQTI